MTSSNTTNHTESCSGHAHHALIQYTNTVAVHLVGWKAAPCTYTFVAHAVIKVVPTWYACVYGYDSLSLIATGSKTVACVRYTPKGKSLQIISVGAYVLPCSARKDTMYVYGARVCVARMCVLSTQSARECVFAWIFRSQVEGIFGTKLFHILADQNYLQPGWVGPLNSSH